MARFDSRWRLGPWVLGTGTILSLTLLAGRVAGLLREIKLAAAFGVTAQADVAVLVLTLPDLLVNLLLSGGLSAALVPRFRALSPAEGAVLFRRALLVAVVVFTAFALLLLVWPRGVFTLLAPGLSHRADLPGAETLALLASALPLTAASGVATAYLNAANRFFLAGCGTLIFNLAVLACLFVGQALGHALLGLCVGICAGALVRAVSQLAALPPAVWSFTAAGRIFDIAFGRAFFVATLAASLMLFVPVLLRATASLLGSGVISSFNYALKLVELPVGIFFGSIATVALSRLSEREAAGDRTGACAAAGHELRRSLLLAQAVSVLGLWFAGSVVRIVLARGAMQAQALRSVEELFQIALLGVPAVAVIGIATAALNAAHRTGSVFTGTARCLALLPILALPGLLVHSDHLLMLALVGFQISLAVVLCRSAGLRALGPHGWLTRSMLADFSICLVLTGLTVGIDAALALSPSMVNDVLRLTLAAIGFVAAVFLTARES
jgi:putative peptidoglycan lipid II flippase